MYDYLIIWLGSITLVLLLMASLGYAAHAYIKWRREFVTVCLFHLWRVLRRGATGPSRDDIKRLYELAIDEYEKHHTTKEQSDGD